MDDDQEKTESTLKAEQELVEKENKRSRQQAEKMAPLYADYYKNPYKKRTPLKIP